MAFKRYLWLLGIFAVAAAWNGCASTTSGTALKDDKIEFIHDGITTRTEVFETLGEPLYDFKPESTIGYTWQTVSPDVTSTLLESFTLGSLGLENDEVAQKDPVRWFLFVKFDRNNRVVRHGKAHQLETESPGHALSKWLKAKSGQN